ncbi:hypothetical protein D3C76_1054100 [compost metagenome]
MSAAREIQLQQALIALIAAANHQGVNIDYLCNQAIGGVLGSGDERWVTPEDVPSAVAEIEKAKHTFRTLWPSHLARSSEMNRLMK